MAASKPSRDVQHARELLAKAQPRGMSHVMLAAAAVHAILAVEQAVRELIDAVHDQS